MPRFKFAFPINSAFLDDNISSFQVADVSFVKKSCISEEFEILNDCKIQFKDNQIFAIVTVCGNESFAKEQAYKRCSLATDIFKICSDLYHNNFYNPKKWQFDIDVDFVTSGKSFCFYKDLDSNNPENFYANFHANRYATYVDTKLLESRTKWNIEDFESLYHILFSPDANKFHEVIKRACHIYSQSFSINNLYERVVLLCTVLDTLATNEREGKVPQLKKYLPEKDVDKLEKIVYRVILQMIRNSTRYKSTQELCIAIYKGSFEPIIDNLPDIYI